MPFYYMTILLMAINTHPILSANIHGITPIKFTGTAAFLVAALSLRRYEVELACNGRIVKLVLMYGLVFIVSAAVNGVGLSTRYGPRFIAVFTFFIATIILIRDRDALARCLVLFVASMDLASLSVIKQYITYGPLYRGYRPGGTFGDSNYYSIAAVVMICLSIFLVQAYRGHRIIQWFCVSSGLLGSVGMLLTQSRGGILGLGVAVLFMLNRSRRKVRNAVILLLFAAMLGTVVPNDVVGRFSEKDTGASVSTKHRIQLIRSGWNMFLANPLLGVGPGTFKQNSESYVEDLRGARLAHNSYLEVAAELGVPGILLFVLLLMYSIAAVNQAIKNSESVGDWKLKYALDGMRYGMIGYVVAAIFLSVEYEKVIWFCVGLASVSEGISRSNSSVQSPQLNETHSPGVAQLGNAFL